MDMGKNGYGQLGQNNRTHIHHHQLKYLVLHGVKASIGGG
jgi:hypothetical protein